MLLISHDIHDVFDVSDRIQIMAGGGVVGTRKTAEVTKEEVLGMIIMGQPADALETKA